MESHNIASDRPYRLGVDLGPNSIGWALIELDEEGNELGLLDTSTRGFLAMGARVFEAGVDKIGTSKESNPNQDRRTARGQRKTIERRAKRKSKVKGLLFRNGFLPTDVQELRKLQTTTDPLEIRARGVASKLTRYEFGRAIYHIAQRRGFKSNRKTGSGDGPTIKQINSLATEIEEGGYQTLGHFLYAQQTESVPMPHLLPRGESGIRGRRTSRDMFEHEFEVLWSAQSQVLKLKDDLKDALWHALFDQLHYEVSEERRQKAPSRANLHRSPALKKCPYFPDKPVCKRSRRVAQRFRILKEVNNLRLVIDWQSHELSAEEREYVLDLLETTRELKFDALRKHFIKHFERPASLRFNLEEGGRQALKGNLVDCQLASKLGKKVWGKLRDDQRDELRFALEEEEDETRAAGVFRRFTEDEGAIAALVERKEVGDDGYLAYSEEALKAVLPYLEEQKLVDHYAFEKALQDGVLGKPRQAGEVGKLPGLLDANIPEELKHITNPVVRRALGEVRKVINLLTHELGRPAEIVVELARENRMNSMERREEGNKMRDREKFREECRQAIQELGGNPHDRNDMIRYQCWVQQSRACLYTGRTIAQSSVFSEEWELDHILPRWRSGDDSQQNLVLVHSSANAAKGNKTPYEWLSSDAGEYKRLLDRAYGLLKPKYAKFTEQLRGLPWGKFVRLKQTELKPGDFISRQLNDTRYISKMVVQYLELLYPPEERIGEKRVRVSRGGVTSELRYKWGLNGILNIGSDEKTREDHRHHAVDAVVIAMSSLSHIKALQDWYQKKDEEKAKKSLEFVEPWPSFRSHVTAEVNKIIVSHRAIRKIKGAFHEATYYGLLRKPDGSIDDKRVVYSKPVSGLAANCLPGETGSGSGGTIRDAATARLVEARVRERGWNGKTKDFPKNWWLNQESGEHDFCWPDGTPVRKVRLVTSIANRIVFEDDEGTPFRTAKLGNNHHIAVYRNRLVRDEAKALHFEVVPTFEVARRIRLDKATMVERSKEEHDFVMSLCRKDMVEMTDPETGICNVAIVAKMSSGPDVFFRLHTDSREATVANNTPLARIRSPKAWLEWKIRKVQVDPLGRVSEDNS